MTQILSIVLLLLLAPLLCGALPKWHEKDRKKLNNGSLIVGSSLLDLSIKPLDIELPEIKLEQAVTKPLIVHPFQAQPDRPLDPLEDSRQPLSEDLLQRYFANAINEGVTDPQNLLSAKERLDVNYALERYAEESPVSIYFYLFDRNQKVPDNYSAKTIFNTFYYSDPSAVVVYYFIEEPERCQVHFGGKDANLIATNKIRDLVSGIRMAAKKRSDKIDQLDDFIRQLSLHMYWIEKSMIKDIYDPIENITPNQPGGSASTRSVTDKVYIGLNHFSRYWWMVALGSTILLIILLSGVWWVKSRRFLFPELHIKPRLHLPNGGSSGGTLSFKDEKQPPSAQRRQFDNPFS